MDHLRFMFRPGSRNRRHLIYMCGAWSFIPVWEFAHDVYPMTLALMNGGSIPPFTIIREYVGFLVIAATLVGAWRLAEWARIVIRYFAPMVPVLLLLKWFGVLTPTPELLDLFLIPAAGVAAYFAWTLTFPCDLAAVLAKAEAARRAYHEKYGEGGRQYEGQDELDYEAPPDPDFTLDKHLIPALHGDVTISTKSIVYRDGTVGYETEEFVTLEPQELGSLPLPSGRIVGGDPAFGIEAARRFIGEIPPGEYPVFITPTRDPAGDIYVAFAFIRFKPTAPVSWREAELEPHSNPQIPVDHIQSMYTDSGMCAYLDPDIRDRSKKANSEFPDMENLERQLGDERLGSLVRLTKDRASPEMAIFKSGRGDGVYQSYWGLDSGGEPCILITDFNLGGPLPGAPYRQIYMPTMKMPE